MSADAVRKFLELARQDAALLGKVREAVAKRGEASSFELVEIAAEYGCEFTATELVGHLTSASAETIELSEAELEAVTGGLTSTTGGTADIRTTLGRIKKTMTPGLMTKRETEPDG
jgi:predicted ribosomally synthesized peptide with nif11-like leader